MSISDIPNLKILIIGEGGVGKSCLLLRFTDDEFHEAFLPTIGVDFKTKYLNINGSKVKLQIWDTAGQEKFRSITKAYYRGAHGILIVFDISRSDTFTQTQEWINSIREVDKSINLILIGNKCDLKRDVTHEEAEEFANKNELRYFETSAKDNTNVEDAFTFLATETYQRVFGGSSSIKKPQSSTVNIDSQSGTKKDGCSC